jgi:beta-lactamase regulating signal transducer with metallopeptidase domain
MELIPIVAGWLVTYAIHSTLMLGIVLLVDRRLKSPVISDQMWKAAAVGAVLSTTAQLGLLSWQPQASPVAGKWDIPAVSVTAQPSPAPREVLPSDGPAVQPAATAAPRIGTLPRKPSLAELLVSVWLIGVLVSCVRLVHRRRAVLTYIGERSATNDAILIGELRDLTSRAGVRNNITLSICDKNVSPLVLGRTEICLPRAIINRLSEEQRRSILAHEIAHIVRHDPEWVAGFAVVEALFFFQPLNRIARKRVKECAEYLCDARAAELLASPIPLAQTLVDIASWLRAELRPLPYPAMAENASRVGDRIERLLEGSHYAMPRGLKALLAGTIALFVLIAPAMTRAVQLSPASQRGGLHLPAFEFRGSFGNGQQFAREYNAWRRRGAEEVRRYVATSGAATVRFTFASREGVCGTGVEKDGTRMFALQPESGWLPAGAPDKLALYVSDANGLKRDDLGVDGTWTTACQRADIRVDLLVRDAKPYSLDITVGDPAPRVTSSLRDAGTIPAAIAGTYLLSLTSSRYTTLAERALLAAVMGRGGAGDEDLNAVIANPEVSSEIKTEARRWIESLEHYSPQKPDKKGKKSPQSSTDNVAIIKDLKQPFEARMAALSRATSAGLTADQLISWYDDVPDRAMRVELIRWLGSRVTPAVERKLVAIVEDAAVLEEQQAALQLLAKLNTPLSKETVRRHSEKHPARSLASEMVLRVVLDSRQPMETRKDALMWAGRNGVPRSLVRDVIPRIESDELRRFVLHWLASGSD